MAEENNNNSNSNSDNNSNNNDWKSSLDKIFDKLDSIMDNKSNGVAKSALRDNGFEDEEIKNIVKQWKEDKQQKSQEHTTKMNDLTTQINQLNEQLRIEKVNNQAFICGLDLGLDQKTIPYVVKLADLSNGVDEKGQISIENIKTAMSKVLDDVPNFKANNNNNGFVKIGADTSNGGNPTQEDVLSKIFGNKKK